MSMCYFPITTNDDALYLLIPRTLVATAKSMESGDIVYSTIAGNAVSKFCMMLFLSALLGVAFGLLSALVMHCFNAIT